MEGVIRRAGWTLMTVLATAIALYAAVVLLRPGFGPPFVGDRRAVMPLALSAHLAGGLLALALGPWQLSGRLRQRALGAHRWMGRGYVVAVTLRIYLPLSQLAGIPFDEAYQAISWACWVPNLVVTEWLLLR
jgi:hypothetical protein